MNLYEYLLIANGLDVLTGISKACVNGNLSSSKLKKGAISKVAIWIVVSVAYLAQEYFEVEVIPYVISYYLLMECVSILENLSEYIPIPDKLKSLFTNSDNITKKTNTKAKETTIDPEIAKMIEEKEKELNE